jgi:hypothetical protein
MPKSKIWFESCVFLLYSRLLLLADCILNLQNPVRDPAPYFFVRNLQRMKEEPLNYRTHEPFNERSFGRSIVPKQTLCTLHVLMQSRCIR